tara:strand:- start:943 stop:1134 length:192 start_codon:yes stop_codon:yes gene_type:complete
MKILNQPKLLLALFAITGSVSAWALINIALVKMNIFEYFVIEIIITLLHLLYNKAKKDFIPQS